MGRARKGRCRRSVARLRLFLLRVGGMVVAYAIAGPPEQACIPSSWPTAARRLRSASFDVMDVKARRGMRRAAVFALLVASPAFAEAPAPAASSATVRLAGMTFVASRAGARELVVEAKIASLQPETHVAMLEQVHSVFDGRPGTPGFDMTCDRGELTTSSNDFLASGNVRGHTADGRSFSTEWVRYDHKRGLAYTDAPVLITENGGTYQGGGFRYLVREQRFRLLGGASLVRSQ